MELDCKELEVWDEMNPLKEESLAGTEQRVQDRMGI